MESLAHLPVFREFENLRQKWPLHDQFLLKAPTGSGKSIALPYLLSTTGLSNGRIMVVQPRRIAARMLAANLARLSGWVLGKEVGYQVRFEKKFSSETKVLYVTDGIALAKLLASDDLADVNVLVLDEFHERSAQIDLCLALALRVWSGNRPDLKILVASATLDLPALQKFMPNCASLEFSERSHPVTLEYRATDARTPPWRQVVELLPKLLTAKVGDLLIFMDGAYEITKAIQSIHASAWSKGLEVYPLHGEMSLEQQDKVLLPSKARKIIVSTNIAETSLTIPGIRIVVDSGRVKKLRFDATRGINSLFSEPISKSSADQRAGRAGRLASGHCIRLWSQSEHKNRPEFDDPEILRTDLSQIYLNLLGAGIEQKELNLLDELPALSLDRAKLNLQALGALDEKGGLTAHGREMRKLPAEPIWAHALIEARKRGFAPAIALVLAMLQDRSPVELSALGDFFPLPNPKSDVYCLILAFEEAHRCKFQSQPCHAKGINARRCKEAQKIARALCSMISEEFELKIPSYEELARLLLRCFPSSVAHLVSAGRSVYQDLNGRKLHLSRKSVLGVEKFVLPLKIVEKKIKGNVVLEMEWVTAFDENMAREELMDKISSSSEVFLDLRSRKVVRKKIEGWRNFTLFQKETEEVTMQETAVAYARALDAGDLKLKKWDSKVEDFLARVRFLATKFPDFGISELDEETRYLLFEQICLKGSTWKQIRSMEVLDFVKNCFSPNELKIIDEAAPPAIPLANNQRLYPLDYSRKGEVVVRVILQELYDVHTHPAIAYGQYPLLVEILAPSRRPVQRTSNLPGFWEGAYPMIRKDLAGRYPKHAWR